MSTDDSIEYEDMPIIKRKSEVGASCDEMIAKMRRLALRGSSGSISKWMVFYKQAKFMEYYSCDEEFEGTFSKYFPTYEDMNIKELKGYFAWRTKLRNGELKKTELSFAFVYIYELLHLVGCETKEDGLRQLVAFFEKYSKLDNRIMRYATKWINDFVVYYDLPNRMLVKDIKSDYEQAVSALVSPDSVSDEALFEAILRSSQYNTEKSAFVKQYPELYKDVTLAVYREMSRRYEAKGLTFCEEMMGHRNAKVYRMFESAVFCDYLMPRKYTYKVGSGVTYMCKGDFWMIEESADVTLRSANMGDMLKNIDSTLRNALCFQTKIKLDPSYRELNEVISEISANEIAEKGVVAVRKLTPEKKTPAVTPMPPKEIVIDVSRLDDIRDAASRTMEKLIAEDEREPDDAETDETGPVAEKFAKEDNPAKETEPVITKENSNFGEPEKNELLSKIENGYLALLVNSENTSDYIKSNMIIESIIVDSINEKFYDIVGDNIIFFNGDTPGIETDYVDDVKRELGL